MANGEVDLSRELKWTKEQIAGWKKVHFVACGTSHYATMVAKRFMESVGTFDIRTEVASEYQAATSPSTRRRWPSSSRSQARRPTLCTRRGWPSQKGASCLVITNVRGSTIHREVGDALITPAGPEIGVAATKTFTAQITILTLLGLYLAKMRGELARETERRLTTALMELPKKLDSILKNEDHIAEMARNFADARGFIGRGVAYPPSLEGALKLKEISYLHAEAYPAGEMKHGPIALLDKELPVVALVPKNDLWEKTVSNIEESMARKAPIIALATEGDEAIRQYTWAEHHLYAGHGAGALRLCGNHSARSSSPTTWRASAAATSTCRGTQPRASRWNRLRRKR